MRNHTIIRQRPPKSQQGVMLIEALVAILIFTIGVIAVMGMQAVSIEQVSQAKYRTDASYLANQITATMWTDVPNILSYQPCTNANCMAWKNTVANTLPSGNGTVFINGTQVTVAVTWQLPNETVAHKFVAVADVNAS